jgi:peptide/nickel transport system substrate-binding protein
VVEKVVTATPEPAAEEKVTENEEPSTTEPVILKVGSTRSLDKINPYWATEYAEGIIFDLVYESLFIVNYNSDFEENLAKSWEMSEDGLTWTFNIVQDSTFHDGTPLTAEDVAFSINLYKARQDSSRWSNVKMIDTAEATGDYSLTINLVEPIPNMIDQLAALWILPKHIWEPLGVETDLEDFINKEMIGSGPFMLKDYEKDQFISLESNKDHWKRPPIIDGVVEQFFNNEDAMVQALISGQLDYVDNAPLTAVRTLEGTDNVQMLEGRRATPHFDDIVINQIDPANCPEDGVCDNHPALRDVSVRQALSHATDKNTITNIIRLGYADVGVSLIQPGSKWYNTDLEDYAFDLDKANQILDEAGYMDVDGDGIREMPDGTNSLVFRLYYPTYITTHPRLAELLAESWAQIGVSLEIRGLESDVLASMVNPQFATDIVLWAWESSIDPNFILSLCSTEMINNWAGESGYTNPEYDELFAAQAVELDEQTRIDLVWQIQEIIMEDAVYIIPYYDHLVNAVRTDTFTNWPFDQATVIPLYMDMLCTIEPVAGN